VSSVTRLLVSTAAAAVLVLLAGCGGTRAAAMVNGTKISGEDVERVLEHAEEEFRREGKTFPEPGTAEYAQLRAQALALLVYQEELDQKARALGVTVDESVVEARLKATRGREEEGEGGSEDERFREAAIRSSLLYRRIYERIGWDLRITPAQVEGYYAKHRDQFRTQGLTLAETRPRIARDLLTAAKNARMARWVSEMRREFAPKIVYGKGFVAAEG
jgi:SurA-like protein